MGIKTNEIYGYLSLYCHAPNHLCCINFLHVEDFNMVSSNHLFPNKIWVIWLVENDVNLVLTSTTFPSWASM